MSRQARYIVELTCYLFVGEISANGFLNLFSGVKSCVNETKRVHIEELLEDAIEVSQSLFDATISERITLLGIFLAMIGSFGVTSHEVVYTTNSGGYNSYSFVGGVQVQNHNYAQAAEPTKKRPPKPGLWCNELVRNIDVAAFYVIQWDIVYGSLVHGRWVATAVQEAIERLSEHNAYEWLRVYPLVKKMNISPRIVHGDQAMKGGKNKSFDIFITEAMDVCDQITIQESTLASLNAMKEDIVESKHSDVVSNEFKGEDRATTVISSSSGLSDASLANCDDIGLNEMFAQAEKGGSLAIRKLAVQNLIRDWLHGVIFYSPSLSALSTFLSLTMGGKDFESVRIPVLCRDDVVTTLSLKISATDLDKNEYINEVVTLLNSVPTLRGPEVATAFLKNDDMDERSVSLCKIVSLCVKDKNWWNEDPGSDCATQNASLTGKWHALSVAAKEFILRKHGIEPEPPLETVRHSSATPNNYFGNLWNTSTTGQLERRPKVLTDAERRELYRKRMTEAFNDVNLLMTEVPLFAVHYNGLFFELGRCWFMRGSPYHVLDALCFNAKGIAHKAQVMDSTSFSGPIVHFAHEKAVKLIEEICRSDTTNNSNLHSRNSSALKILRTVIGVLSAREVLAHSLLFELVKSVTGSQLEKEEATATANFAATLMSSLSVQHQSSRGADEVPKRFKPALSSILDSSTMWESIVMWYESSSLEANQPNVEEDTPLVLTINSVRNTLLQTTNQLQSTTIVLELMQALMVHENRFYSLLNHFKVGISAGLKNTFSNSALQVEQFDSTLEQVQTYAFFFCSCGVKVQFTELRSLVDDLRKRYNYLQICELKHTITIRNTIALPYTSWLYELRSSGLFLHFWRLVGREICLESMGGSRPGASPPVVDDNHNLAQGLGLGQLFDETAQVDGIDIAAQVVRGEDETIQNLAVEEEEELRNVERLENESEEDFAGRVTQLQQARMQRLQQQFEVQDRRAQLLSTVEEVVLSQEDVVGKLIPRVQALWGKLALDTFTGSILMSELDSSFSAILDGSGNDSTSGNDDQVIALLAGELRLLANGLDGTKRFEVISAQNLPLGCGISTILSKTTQQLRDYVFLRKLLKWIPCLIRVHQLLDILFVTPLCEDQFRLELIDTEEKINVRLETLTMREMSGLVSPLQSMFEKYNTCGQVDFVAAMSLSPEMTNWLLAQSSTEEFNRLLQVVRPCTDEPRLLSAIASLVHVRTLLLQPLYGPLGSEGQKYNSFLDFLEVFSPIDLRSTGGGNSGLGVATDGNSNTDALWHLLNVVSCFEGLMDVFEKQTRSPGIKSCYDLKEIMDRGTFVLSVSDSPNDIVKLELSSKDDATTGGSSTETMDYLLDLRSKLLMTEIPPELDEEMAARAMVEAFTIQLQVLSELSDTLAALCTAGHIVYQEDHFQQRFRFTLDGLPALQNLLSRLLTEQQSWALEVKSMRKKYYYLNFFTMREILRIRSLLKSHLEKGDEGSGSIDNIEKVVDSVRLARMEISEGDAQHPSKGQDERDHIQNIDSVELMEQMGFSRDWALAALRRVGDNNVEAAIEFCFANTQVMDRFAAEDSAAVVHQNVVGTGFDASNNDSVAFEREVSNLEPIMELHGLLHLVASSVDILCVHQLVEFWQQAHSVNDDKELSVLSVLGFALSQIFESSEMSVNNRAIRRIRLPLDGAVNQVDMLVSIEASDSSSALGGDKENEKKLPLFVACTDSPLLVIDTVLSVYVRRGRLPEPGELMFCTADTTLEDLTLMLYRFITSKSASFSECTSSLSGSVFCIADLHNLSYTLQSALVEKIRNVVDEFGTKDATTLLLVSGLPRQVALNALSAHMVDLPPLDLQQLRVSLAESFRLHCGDTLCVASEINGGGKSHFILEEVANRQRDGEPIWYRKVPIREGSSHESLVHLMTQANINLSKSTGNAPGEPNHLAFHIDIAHIIPPAANTMLFQLLLIGVLRDPIKNRVYFRNSADLFYLEIPNSIRNKTVKALRFCNLLPHTILETNAASLKFVRPVVQGYPTVAYPVSGTHIRLEDYVELRYVTQWLKGVRDGKTRHGSDTYDSSFSPWSATREGGSDLDKDRTEFFDILVQYCCKPDSAAPLPSYSLFRNFVMFMNMQFGAVEKYPLLSSDVLSHIDGLENFKHVFLILLIATSCDFSVRSVPQVLIESGGVGPSVQSAVLYDDTLVDNHPPVEVESELETPDLERNVSNGSSGLGPPSLVRRTSSEQRRVGLTQAQQNTIPGMVRQTSEEIVNRFEHMLSWEQSEHPIVCFKMDIYGDVNGVDILSLNPTFVDRHINGHLKQVLEQNYLKFNKDWSSLTNEEGVTILRQIAGLRAEERGGLGALEPGYVMTVDNLLKMLSIQLRLRFSLPVVIMGETGCGKSTLIRNMCAILGVPLHILNVHGGIEDSDIMSWMNDRIDIANRMTVNPTERLVLLLDEINTCNCMGLFKEIVCDRTLNGVPLPDKIQIIAACNPYRLRTTRNLYGGEEMAGLVFEQGGGNGVHVENVGTGIKDPLRNLVYRVHPLPESMIDHIYDFGALSSDTESLYIKAMLRRHLEMYSGESLSTEETPATTASGMGAYSHVYQYRPVAMSPLKEFVEVFAELVCSAQECVRELHEGERSAASLRDVSRCMKVFMWFGEHLANTVGGDEGWTLEDFFSVKATAGSAHRNAQITPKIQRAVRRAVILSLAYCYHARLPRQERKLLVNTLTQKWRSLQTYQYPTGGYGGGYGAGANFYNRPKCTWLNLDARSFIQVLEETQREFVSVMNLGEGIALNEALCENLFMILCSILNQIPIFVIGKPGSSKSLAMGLVQSNLNGDASDHPFLKTLPAVEVFSYQCSPLSTSQGIEQAFESSRRYRREAENTVVVVLLDEVGLAEQSPHLPLKVLHKVLDEAGGREAVVGISNWALDPAKMNRAVHLYRPAPTVEDLSLTAEGMVRSANLKGYLHELARAYNEIYHSQEHADFWGLREFYSTVKAINSAMGEQFGQCRHIEDHDSSSGSGGVALDGSMLMNAILRNFGGRPSEMEKIVTCFFQRLGISLSSYYDRKNNDMATGCLAANAVNTAGMGWRDVRIESLIRSNLLEPIAARHLMLLTRNNAALSLLLDRKILMQHETEIIFGSDFPLDQTDLQVCLNIQRVKLCMAEGITVVLVHCESLYESLYDLLNQHYVEYSGQIYVRLAFGSYTRLCPLHRNFRVIVIVEKEEAYTKLAPPLLNRFEKQVFERSHVLVDAQTHLLRKLTHFAMVFASHGSSTGSVSENRAGKPPLVSLLKRDDDVACSLTTLRAAFCGYHSDMLSSLILAVTADLEEKKSFTASTFSKNVGSRLNVLKGEVEEADETMERDLFQELVFKECVKRLLWVATPEVTCTLMMKKKVLKQIGVEFDIECPATEYFQHQCHSSIPAFSKRVIPQWQDTLGSQVLLLTYSALTQDVASIMELQGGFDVTHIVLHELDQERELKGMVTTFFQNAQAGSLLLVQCDPIATSRRRIEHTKFLIELFRSKKLNELNNQRKDVDVQTCDNGIDELEGSEPGSEFKGECRQEVIIKSNDLAINDESEKKDLLKSTHYREEVEVQDNSREEASLQATLNDLKSEMGIHVVILVHLPRGDASNVMSVKSRNAQYALDFDTRWRAAFIDSMSISSNGLPEAETIIHRPLLDLLCSNELKLKQLLTSVCRSSLAKLYTTFDRSNVDVKRQIGEITRCLEHESFVELCQETLERLLSFQNSGNTVPSEDATATGNDITSKALNERELQLAGSFQAALHKQILDTMAALFAVVLSHMDRNNSLTLYRAKDEPENFLMKNQELVWIYLFKQSFNPSVLLSHLKSSDTGRKDSSSSVSIELKSDACGGNGIFDSQFPFSFYLLPLFETLRKVTNGGGNRDDHGEAQLRGQIRTLCLDHMSHLTDSTLSDDKDISGASTPLYSDSMYRFTYDLTCMRCKPVNGLSRVSQTRVMQRLILCVKTSSDALKTGLANGKVEDDVNQNVKPPPPPDFENEEIIIKKSEAKISLFSEVLYNFWVIERPLALYFDLLDTLSCNPDADFVLGLSMSVLVDDCLQYLFSIPTSCDLQEVHRGFLTLILQHLNPCTNLSKFIACDIDKSGSSRVFKSWTMLLSSLHSPFFSLLDLMVCRREKEILMVKFLHFEFYQSFLRDVAWPFSLSAKQAWEFLSKFDNTCGGPGDHLVLATSPGLHLVLGGLEDLGTELWATDGVPHDFLCPITLDRMTDPVIAADGHTYERVAIENWISSGQTTSPFDTSNDRALISKTLIPNFELKLRLDQWIEGVDLASFLEHYMLDVVFHPLYKLSLTKSLLKEIIQLLAGKALHLPGGLSKTRHIVAASLIPRGNAIEGVLKELFHLQATVIDDLSLESVRIHMKSLSDSIDEYLEEALCSSILENKYVDTPICVAYVNVRQASLILSSSTPTSPLCSLFPVDLTHLRQGVIEGGGQGGGARLFLNVVANTRCLLAEVASRLCRHVGDEYEDKESDGYELEALLSRVNMILDDDENESANEGELKTMVHSMRMYFLKLIAQSKGVSFLRQVLLTPPLSFAPWLKRWRDGVGAAAIASGVDTIGFTRFLGSNLLPRVNPFVNLPNYKYVQAQVAQGLQSGDVTALSHIFARMDASGSPVETECRFQQCRYLSGLLLLALFNEIALLSLLPTEAVQTQLQTRVRLIETWIFESSGPTLACLSAVERHVIVFFGLGRFSVLANSNQLSASEERLKLTSSSPPAVLIQVRVMTHLVATSLMCPSNHPGHFIHTIIFRPELMLLPNAVSSPGASTRKEEGSYLPTMPEDMMKMAQNVMGGRWYACPFGHPFYVDLCGRPTVIQNCAECGAQIGGEGHNLLADNKDLGNVGKGYYDKTVLEDCSERLYCVRPASEEKSQGLTLAAPRGLSPSATRVIRLFLHLSMSAGVVVASSSCDSTGNKTSTRDMTPMEGCWSDVIMKSFFNSSFPAPPSISMLPSFLRAHVEQDWGVLQNLNNLQEDEAGLLLHGMLNTLITNLGKSLGFGSAELVQSVCSPYNVSSCLAEIPGGLSIPTSQVSSDLSFATFGRSSDRDFWETYFDKVCITPWLTPTTANCSLSDHLKVLTTAWGLDNDEYDGNSDKAGSASHFTVVLLEKESSPLTRPTLQISSLLPDRRSLLPMLWRLPRVFCFDEFVSSLNMIEATYNGKLGGDVKKYPVLSRFMDMFASDAKQLHALQFLPQVFEWFSCLRRHYSGHITREDARKMNHLDALRNMASSDPRGHLTNVFTGYSQAWNSSWNNVQKFGCIQFSPDFKSIQMGADVPLTFSLPNAMDEGNCPLALTHFLVEKQNTFAQLLDEYFLLQKRDRMNGAEDSTSRRVGVVSSRFLTPAHTIRCDLHRELIPLLEKYCMLYSSDGDGNTRNSKYDFVKAEKLLVERFLLDVSAVDLEMPGFTFKNEQHLQGGMGPLRQKLKQSLLPYETTQALLRDIKTPYQAQYILDLLETVIAFVTATGGTLVTKLSEEKLGQMKLGQYISDVLMLPVDGGDGLASISRVVQHQVQLTHLEALYNLLTEVTNCDIFAKVHQAYKKPLDNM